MRPSSRLESRFDDGLDGWGVDGWRLYGRQNSGPGPHQRRHLGRSGAAIACQPAQQGQFSKELGKRWGRVVTQGAPSNGGPRGHPQHGRWQGSLQASSSIPRTAFGRQLDVSQLVCALLRFLRFGTFLPLLRASERAMAIACLRLFTVPPLPPLLLFKSRHATRVASGGCRRLGPQLTIA